MSPSIICYNGKCFQAARARLPAPVEDPVASPSGPPRLALFGEQPKSGTISHITPTKKLKKFGHKFQYDLGGFGGYQAIMIKNDIYIGASDSRKDGQASGY